MFFGVLVSHSVLFTGQVLAGSFIILMGLGIIVLRGERSKRPSLMGKRKRTSFP